MKPDPQQSSDFASLPEAPDPLQAERDALAERVRRLVYTQGEYIEQIPGLHLSCVERSVSQPNCFYVLSVGVILRGRKRLCIGDKTYEYGGGAMIVTSIDMPTSYELLDVSPSAPFISLSLRLNPAILAELLTEENPQAEPEARTPFCIEEASEELIDDFTRLLKLADRPAQIEVRAPLIIRDIHYLALSGTAGECLRALYAPSAGGIRIRQAVRWLRENFREPVKISQLADVAHMSEPTFYRQFKQLTSLSPIQYQKRLRLYEAQQFLLRGDGDVNSAAYAVGYQSPQQFNRDYKKFFGETPGRGTRTRRQALQGALG